MNRKRMIAFLALLLLLSFLLILPLGAEPAISQSVYDGAMLLDRQAQNNLTAQIDSLRSETGCSFFVATHKMRTPYDEYWGVEFLQDYGYSEQSNMIILIVTLDRETYYYDMYTYGNATRKIPDHEVDYILDQPEVFNNIKSGSLEEGISAFLSYSAKAYDGLVGPFYIRAFVISLIIALVVGGLVCLAVYNAYKAKKRSVDYPLDRFAKLELNDKQDVFAGSFVTKRVINTNNGSSRGGSFGGGGGRGGGGGHRGGR